jgi:hypothetical protein
MMTETWAEFGVFCFILLCAAAVAGLVWLVIQNDRTREMIGEVRTKVDDLLVRINRLEEAKQAAPDAKD